MHQVRVSDDLDGWIYRNPAHIGVSIEATDTTFSGDNIVKATGTGVTFVFPPFKPACSIEEGCGVAGANTEEPVTEKQSVTADEPAGDSMSETIEATMKELADIKAKLVDSEAVSAALKVENDKLVAFKTEVIENERKALLAQLGVKIGDVVAYEQSTVCELKRTLVAIEAASKIQFSGAEVKDDVQPNVGGYSKEDLAAHEEAKKIAAARGIKME
jgi:regulator of replication initiation timing